MTPPAAALAQFVDDPILEALCAGWEPEVALTVSEWADTHRMLSAKDSAEHGKWSTARTPYLRDVMDALSEMHPARRVVFMAASQLGKTQAGNNWIGYTIHHSPAPMLLVLPNLDTAKNVSKQRLAPMIEATPVLSERVTSPRERDSGNTLLLKEFTGGLLRLAGANAPAGLKQMPAKNLFLDELDEYPAEVGGTDNMQGDPVALAEARTKTFTRRKIYVTSTPTVAGLSRIEAEFKATDRRRYMLPCPECGTFDYLTWNGRDTLDAVTGSHHRIEFDEDEPDSVHMVCSACDAKVLERHKEWMLDPVNGAHWQATAVCSPEVIGFHLSSLYSTLGFTWRDAVVEFLKAKNDPTKLKAWVNGVLGETWEERGGRVDPAALLERREEYGFVPGMLNDDGAPRIADVPAGVGALIASIDVQADRIEVLVKGYGAGEESWYIAHEIFQGDPAQLELWLTVDAWLLEPLYHESGQVVPIDGVFIDSNYLTDHVLKFCEPRRDRRVIPIRGGNDQTAPLIPLKPSRNNRYRLPHYTLGVSDGKDIVHGRLRILRSGPGRIHLPKHLVDQEFVDQLTAEKAIPKYVRGKGRIREWTKIRDRNEILDMTVYALAGLRILGAGFIKLLPKRAAQYAIAPDAPAALAEDVARTELKAAEPEASPSTGRPKAPRRESWVNKWKK